MIESTLEGGFHVGWLKDFKKRNVIVHALEYELRGKAEKTEYSRICSLLHGSKYDYKGVAFWIVVGLLYKLKILKKDELDGFNNRWADRNSVYCVEILKAQSKLIGTLGFDTGALERQNLRPHRAYTLLKATGKFKDVI